MGRSSGESAMGLLVGVAVKGDFFFSQFQLPTEADVGSPSSALRAAASTNLPPAASARKALRMELL
jgi:hypothetical protein